MNTVTRAAAGLLSTGAALACLAATSPAWALTATTVTIHADGTDLSGHVASSDPACVEGRKVLLIKQVGARGGGNDQRIASDLADSAGNWDTGNTGIEGKFYAKVRATDTCGRDTSRTVRAVRNP
ncbi:MAG TPA: hypothetical protein VNS55_07415 [Nocardioides sp.]|nr:hypothetical protein [Nocardioides sp.]